jgi:hypothetical protein
LCPCLRRASCGALPPGSSSSRAGCGRELHTTMGAARGGSPHFFWRPTNLRALPGQLSHLNQPSPHLFKTPAKVSSGLDVRTMLQQCAALLCCVGRLVGGPGQLCRAEQCSEGTRCVALRPGVAGGGCA